MPDEFGDLTAEELEARFPSAPPAPPPPPPPPDEPPPSQLVRTTQDRLTQPSANAAERVEKMGGSAAYADYAAAILANLERLGVKDQYDEEGNLIGGPSTVAPDAASYVSQFKDTGEVVFYGTGKEPAEGAKGGGGKTTLPPIAQQPKRMPIIAAEMTRYGSDPAKYVYSLKDTQGNKYEIDAATFERGVIDPTTQTPFMFTIKEPTVDQTALSPFKELTDLSVIGETPAQKIPDQSIAAFIGPPLPKGWKYVAPDEVVAWPKGRYGPLGGLLEPVFPHLPASPTYEDVAATNQRLGMSTGYGGVRSGMAAMSAEMTDRATRSEGLPPLREVNQAVASYATDVERFAGKVEAYNKLADDDPAKLSEFTSLKAEQNALMVRKAVLNLDYQLTQPERGRMEKAEVAFTAVGMAVPAIGIPLFLLQGGASTVVAAKEGDYGKAALAGGLTAGMLALPVVGKIAKTVSPKLFPAGTLGGDIAAKLTKSVKGLADIKPLNLEGSPTYARSAIRSTGYVKDNPYFHELPLSAQEKELAAAYASVPEGGYPIIGRTGIDSGLRFRPASEEGLFATTGGETAFFPTEIGQQAKAARLSLHSGSITLPDGTIVNSAVPYAVPDPLLKVASLRSGSFFKGQMWLEEPYMKMAPRWVAGNASVARNPRTMSQLYLPEDYGVRLSLPDRTLTSPYFGDIDESLKIAGKVSAQQFGRPVKSVLGETWIDSGKVPLPRKSDLSGGSLWEGEELTYFRGGVRYPWSAETGEELFRGGGIGRGRPTIGTKPITGGGATATLNPAAMTGAGLYRQQMAGGYGDYAGTTWAVSPFKLAVPSWLLEPRKRPETAPGKAPVPVNPTLPIVSPQTGAATNTAVSPIGAVAVSEIRKPEGKTTGVTEPSPNPKVTPIPSEIIPPSGGGGGGGRKPPPPPSPPPPPGVIPPPPKMKIPHVNDSASGSLSFPKGSKKRKPVWGVPNEFEAFFPIATMPSNLSFSEAYAVSDIPVPTVRTQFGVRQKVPFGKGRAGITGSREYRGRELPPPELGGTQL